MGDYFQILVAPDVAAAQAKAEGDRMLAWLIEEGIVSDELTECVFGGTGVGHPPGREYAKATGGFDGHLLGLRTNGLGVIVGRTVFHSGSDFELVCAACAARFERLDAWSDAVDEWFSQRGPGTLACPACGVSRSIAQWQHDPPWGFGELGFEFWNWPHFEHGFVEAFERQLGSRVVHVYGKL